MGNGVLILAKEAFVFLLFGYKRYLCILLCHLLLSDLQAIL